MTKYIEGDMNGKGLRFGIVVSRFNDLITSNLLSGALSAFVEQGVDEKDLEVVRVPGAFEIPQAAKKLCSSRELDGIVCLGAVIKGGTPHFEYISAETTEYVAKSLDIPRTQIISVIEFYSFLHATPRVNIRC